MRMEIEKTFREMSKEMKLTEDLKKEISEIFSRLDIMRAEEETLNYLAENVFKPKD